MCLRPRHEQPAGELRRVVGPKHQRVPAKQPSALLHARDGVLTRDTEVHRDLNALAGDCEPAAGARRSVPPRICSSTCPSCSWWLADFTYLSLLRLVGGKSIDCRSSGTKTPSRGEKLRRKTTEVIRVADRPAVRGSSKSSHPSPSAGTPWGRHRYSWFRWALFCIRLLRSDQ